MGLLIVIAAIIVVIAVLLIMLTKKSSNNNTVEDSEEEKEEDKKRKWNDPNEQEKFVCQGGKVQCQFSKPPTAGIVVTSTQVMLQDKPYVTTGDKDGKVNFNFTGVCTHPSQQKPLTPPPPCKLVIKLGEWKNFSETLIDNHNALLVRSTIPCLISGQDIKIIDSGQKAVLTDVKPEVKKNPITSVTIAKVIRGNPYVSRNAKAAGLPDSVPLNKTYEVEVKVVGSGTVNLAIINSSGDNGNATVTPATITGTTKVIVKGTAQTKSGHGGKLKIEAKVDGKVKATSQGFSVCCHPINYTDIYSSDINRPNQIGFVVKDGWSSDNGVLSDLIDTEISELVKDIKSDSPPFTPLGAGKAINSGYMPGDKITYDTHTIGPRPNAGPVGTQEFGQLCIYKCHCCGCTDIDFPNSGFKIIHKVFKVGTQWKHNITKIGEDMTIGAYSSKAGNGNVISPDHNLP